MHPIWLLLVLAVAVPLAARAYRRRRGQKRELEKLARARGLTFSPLDLIGLHERYYSLELIRRGHNRCASDLLCGSIDAGLVAVFRYSYDVGFGVEQSTRRCWIAVLESAKPLAPWRATPASDRGTEPGGESTRVGPFRVRTARGGDFDRLGSLGLWTALAEMPDFWHFESQGTLLAIAAPQEEDLHLPAQLLNAVGRLCSVS